MPYENASEIALNVVMDDAIPMRWAEVIGDGLNLRTYPAVTRNGTDVPVVLQLSQGQRLRVWSIRDDGWLGVTVVKDAKTYGGWVSSTYTQFIG